MPTPQTRFVVEANGISNEILSVGESKNGDLGIFHKGAGPHIHPDGQRTPVLDQKTSVHVSPNSPGTTLMYSLKLDGGKSVRHSTFVLGPKDELLWVVRALVPPRPTFSHTPTKLRQKDRSFRLKEYESQFQSLAYAIVVSSKQRQFPALPRVFNLEVAEFEKFNIGLYYSFFTLPSLAEGSWVTFQTTKPVLEEGQTPERHSEGARPISDEEMFLQLRSLFGRLASRTFEQTQDSFAPELRPIAYEMAHLFTANPVNGLEEFERERSRGLVTVFPPIGVGTFIRGAF